MNIYSFGYHEVKSIEIKIRVLSLHMYNLRIVVHAAPAVLLRKALPKRYMHVLLRRYRQCCKWFHMQSICNHWSPGTGVSYSSTFMRMKNVAARGAGN